jgi:sporulation protein YlmC with PRC-barrel domain
VRRRGETWFRPLKPPEAWVRPEHALIAAGRVTGSSVFDGRGRRVGRIVDLAIDEESGSVMLALLAKGGVWGLGERMLQVAWADLSYDSDRAAYVLQTDSAHVAGASGLEPANIEWGAPTDRGGWA